MIPLAIPICGVRFKASVSPILLPKHTLMKADNSILVISSQDPCFGVCAVQVFPRYDELQKDQTLQGRDAVRVEIFADKDEHLGMGKVFIHKFLDFFRPVHFAPVSADCRPSQAFMRSR